VIAAIALVKHKDYFPGSILSNVCDSLQRVVFSVYSPRTLFLTYKMPRQFSPEIGFFFLRNRPLLLGPMRTCCAPPTVFSVQELTLPPLGRRGEVLKKNKTFFNILLIFLSLVFCLKKVPQIRQLPTVWRFFRFYDSRLVE